VPPFACSALPMWRLVAPVNAPRSKPKSSLSKEFAPSVRASQLSATNGESLRSESSWMLLATYSLPVPALPRMRTVAAVGAIWRTSLLTSRISRVLPMSSPGMPSMTLRIFWHSIWCAASTDSKFFFKIPWMLSKSSPRLRTFWIFSTMAVKVVFSRASISIWLFGESLLLHRVVFRRPDAALGEMNAVNIVIICVLVLQKCNKVIVFYKNVIISTKNRRFCTVQRGKSIASFKSVN